MSAKRKTNSVSRIHVALIGLCVIIILFVIVRYGTGFGKAVNVLGVTTRTRILSAPRGVPIPILPTSIPVGTEGEGCGGTSNQQCRQDLVCVPVCLLSSTTTTNTGGITWEEQQRLDAGRKFSGVCAKKNIFSGKTDAACKRGGCSGQLCLDASAQSPASTCQWKAQYACYQAADCVKQTTGTCGFTQTDTLTACLKNAQ